MNQPTQNKAACGKPGLPWGVVSLTINAICFWGCLVLLVLGTVTGPLVLLAIGTGLSAGAGFAAVLKLAGRQRHDSHPSQSPTETP